MNNPTTNLKLFMVYVGGHTPTSNLEVHDMRFVVGETIEDTYTALQDQWWGEPDTLHLDCWGVVNQIDGYDVTLSIEKAPQDQKLFFVNLGGYDPARFDELHKNVLIVAESEVKAKERAKEDVTHWQVPHKDTLFDIEKCLSLTEQLAKEGLYIHLKKSDTIQDFKFKCTYKPISEKALAKRKK